MVQVPRNGLCDMIVMCDIGTATGPEPGIRCDANPVARSKAASLARWGVILWRKNQVLGGSSPPKLFVFGHELSGSGR